MSESKRSKVNKFVSTLKSPPLTSLRWTSLNDKSHRKSKVWEFMGVLIVVDMTSGRGCAFNEDLIHCKLSFEEQLKAGKDGHMSKIYCAKKSTASENKMASPSSQVTEETHSSKCLFCSIAQRQDSKTRILYEKDNIIIFKDIRPASDHHYLVIPHNHVNDPKHLNHNDVKLIEQLVAVGKEFLAKEGGSLDDARLGFHWPPFNSISHLHLHVISPVKNIRFIGSLIYKPNSLWFVTPDWLIERLKNMKQSD
ncbi:Histidine triad nucleotide-binding protein 3 [Bulinus truncatus]|nr:Histidine triad nucleotide-binding protein 3 [Bulinus truncatus]